MRLDEFESHVDGKILRRGYGYYKSGSVVSLERDGGEWAAQVLGGDCYDVTVTLSEGGDVVDSFCGCPYEWGEYCKHQAAVFYAIRDEGRNKTAGPPEPSRKETLENIIQGLEKPVLASIILELAEQHDSIKNSLMLRYADKGDITVHARALIRGAVKSVMRRGFVEYGDVARAIEGALEALGQASELRGGGGFLDCARLCVVVAEEMMDLMNNCDDSGGDAGGAVESAIELLRETADGIPEGHPDAEGVFRAIISHADGKLYDGWRDWRMKLLSACAPLCGNPGLREELEAYFLRMRMRGQKNERSDWENRYLNSGIQRIALDIISRFDGPERAEAFIEQNLENSDFRRRAIEKAFEQNNPGRALRLCLEGEAMDEGYGGLTSSWKKHRYAAYELLGDMDGQKALAMEFVMDGVFEYFPRLKNLYPPGEWGAVLENLLGKLESGASKHGVYVSILTHEGLKPRILAYCRQHPRSLTSLYPHLLPDYEDEVAELFEGLIPSIAERASNRREYQEVCAIIKHYATACGKEAAAKVASYLLSKYPRRPAFVDELKRLGLS